MSTSKLAVVNSLQGGRSLWDGRSRLLAHLWRGWGKWLTLCRLRAVDVCQEAVPSRTPLHRGVRKLCHHAVRINNLPLDLHICQHDQSHKESLQG